MASWTEADLAIRDRLGFGPKRVQTGILENHFGELPVGAAVIVPTDNPDWPYLIAAPTMRVPEPVPHTLNAYLAFRAVLVAVWRFNQKSKRKIRSVLVPGLATGVGGMSARRCAGQMKVAWSQVRGKPRIPSYKAIHQVHQALKLAD
ncbi:MAG: macro domain-containing protein [Myxococcota bacterium]